MKTKTIISIALLGILLLFVNCKENTKKVENEVAMAITHPSDVIPFMDEWKILCGDGTHKDSLVDFSKKDFFYVENDGNTDWVVYKTPNAGITSKTSSNTRTELGQKSHWTPETGGKLTGTLKVMHVSTTGDATKASSFSTVIGQIHSDEGMRMNL